jgi:hypothetical protein
MDANKLNTLRQRDEDPSRIKSNDGSVRPAVDTGFRKGMNARKFLNQPKATGRTWGADGT